MQKNWYAAYTKPHCEKKVSHLLTKKGIENFCPYRYHKTQPFLQTKILYEPLFKSYVFVRATEHDIINLSKEISYILSFLYWTSKLATINGDEINAIKEFSENHSEIELERVGVNVEGVHDIHEVISYTTEGKILKKTNRVIKVNLPSLGFAMMAKTEDGRIRGTEIFLINKDLPAPTKLTY